MPHLEEIWNLFLDASSCRQIAFGPCPLLASEIKTVLDFNQIRDPDRRYQLFEVLKRLDAVFLEMAAQSKSKEMKGANSRTHHKRQKG